MRKEQMQTTKPTQQTQDKQEMQTTKQGGVYFITFVNKVDPEKAREILTILRNKFTGMYPVFMPKPPRGRRTIIEINETIVILTFPYGSKRTNQSSTQVQEGFKLKDLIKKT
ncbi:hypothetical protein [Thermocrinis sp.]|jgi:hypothetical protein|uniref:hypothetical protein n=1 Tax=Thermocrinis sp. TaxID=2024383 RepID=UPI003C1196D4